MRRVSNKFLVNTGLSLREFSRFKGLVMSSRTRNIDFFGWGNRRMQQSAVAGHAVRAHGQKLR